ncbi:LIM/homeobox protein Awh [Melitaea cinxia]|uniref:LIM/homeobox protein Awh n=1 Tax=Melitaea cinxia TaxID=113334 RepID=UPI001E273113|nr:LIM/homeobox protein Awh [Melitaea cinxia]
MIENKAMDGDLKNAVRILFSSDTLAPFDNKTLEALREKHPLPNPASLLPSPPIFNNVLQVKDEDTYAAIMSFTSGSASGIDGITSQHLKDLTEHRTCCACGEPIADRFLLEVGGGAWHTGCLRCCVCAIQLDRHPSCFLRDRQVYCKQDYAKSFGAKCSKCCRGISSSDWVRKAREQVYHLACFACDACGRQLSTGEQFALHEDRVLCKPHYLETLDGGSISSDDGCDSEGYHKSKAKRVRTTFTEEQLQVLQANFQLDSNPDGQDLERIAQVTGLSKRVTQVWFQNSRARQKKHQHTGKGKQNQAMSRDSDPVGFGRPINLHLTYSFQNKPPFVPIDGTSFTDSSMDELSEDSSIHCMQSEV